MIIEKGPKSRMKKNVFEKNAWEKNYFVCGIDEVGRGCFAGPLVVGAVILPIGCSSRLLKDSKVLTPQERENAYEWIIRNCGYATASLSWKDIDRLNIYSSTLKAMSLALLNLVSRMPFDKTRLKYVLVDAMPLKIPSYLSHPDLECHNFNYGETYSSSIAAASILAKVTRDRLMEKMGLVFPSFELGKHKGYGTALHQKAILENGLSIIHRKSFVNNLTLKIQNMDIQRSVFDLEETSEI